MAANDIFSASWHRVSGLRPRLRGHAQMSRHFYRGQLWYVLQDHSSRRVHRFAPTAYTVIGLMDGHRTVGEIWDAACSKLGDDAPTQEEIIRLLAQLHGADILQCEIPPDVDEMLRRRDKLRSMKLIALLMSPLSMKFPLFDPERFLNATVGLVRPLFTWYGALLWLAIVAGAVVEAGLHWPELTKDITDRALAPQNLLLIWLTFPVLKAFHEFGHAYAVKRWGGEVHEMGIMLLVFMPVPYVDASAASAFREKYPRVVVGSAGMLVEAVVAALAVFVWVNVEPGLVRSVAYNVILIAGVSTLVFNANPLLRFDGYYIFGDLIEIPNLRARANRYFMYLVERHLLGMAESQEPEGTPSEKRWMLAFAISSFIYRMFVTFAIVMLVAGKYFIFGVILAGFALVGALVLPLVKGIAFLLYSPRLRRMRLRAAVSTTLFVGVLGALVFLVPAPMWTRAEGVIWVPEQAIVRPGTEGFVAEVVARPNSQVRPGDPILKLDEPLLSAHIRVLRAKVEQYEAQYRSERYDEHGQVRAELTLETLRSTQAELARALEKAAALEVRAPVEGRLVLARADDLPARFVRQGQDVAYIVDGKQMTARVVVPQQDIDLVRSRTRAIEVRLTEDVGVVLPARVRREVPAATAELPNLALAMDGGGKVALDPREKTPRALQKFFDFELSLPVRENVHIGSRIYVRFDHGSEPLAFQWYRSLRQVFLKQLNV
ncbi:MAG TPA: PqqD family peptide modification chaperone [Burkholderiales bacterium]|jgi:putative peptide zinc metalloprotease protein|nr:PqqD family peptide modification chaperone [Burkholderiales bacterium]